MLGAWWGQRSDVVVVPPSPLEMADGESAEDGVVPVHVSGWVVSPGVVWVQAGSLVSEAIAAAGGALAGADLDAINLAQEVYEGDQLVVARAGSDAGGAETSVDGLIDINRADATELQALPGVGPVLAANIISQRDAVGRFESVEDLLDVPGIGETRLASIRDLIRPP
jgi:competence protein ComEA